MCFSAPNKRRISGGFLLKWILCNRGKRASFRDIFVFIINLVMGALICYVYRLVLFSRKLFWLPSAFLWWETKAAIIPASKNSIGLSCQLYLKYFGFCLHLSRDLSTLVMHFVFYRLLENSRLSQLCKCCNMNRLFRWSTNLTAIAMCTVKKRIFGMRITVRSSIARQLGLLNSSISSSDHINDNRSIKSTNKKITSCLYNLIAAWKQLKGVGLGIKIHQTSDSQNACTIVRTQSSGLWMMKVINTYKWFVSWHFSIFLRLKRAVLATLVHLGFHWWNIRG